MAIWDTAGVATTILKTVQKSGRIEDIFNSDDQFVGKLQKDDDPEGLKWESMVRMGRSGGFGWGDPDVDLPAARRATYKKPLLIWKDFLARIQVYESMVARAKTDIGSYVRPIMRAVRDMIIDSSDDINRAIFGDGSGAIGFTVAGATGTDVTTETITLRNPTVTGNPVQPADALKFVVGQNIQAYITNAPGGTLVIGNAASSLYYTVAAVDEVAGTFTVSQNLLATGATDELVDNNAYFYHYDPIARTVNESKEIMGLYGIVSNANPPMATTGSTDEVGLNGLDVLDLTNSRWKSTVLSNSNVLRPITTRLCTQALDGAHIRGGGKPSLIVMPMNLRTEFIESQLAIRRNVNQSIMAGSNTAGFTENRDAGQLWECNGIPIWPDKYARTYTALFLDMSELYLKRVRPPDWWTSGDGQMWRAIANRLGQEASLYGVMNLCTTNRAAHAIITDLQQVA